MAELDCYLGRASNQSPVSLEELMRSTLATPDALSIARDREASLEEGK